MNDLMLLAIEQFEDKLKEISLEASGIERDLENVTNIRKKLVSVVNDISQEYARKASAINKYNLEIERISKYGRRALELAKNTLPVEIQNIPEIKDAERISKEIHDSVKNKAIDFSSIKDKGCGVYFLLNDDDIVYIGQSVDCFNRVLTHSRDVRKEFNRTCYIPVCRDELNDIEETLISIFKPKHNVRGINSRDDNGSTSFNDL